MRETSRERVAKRLRDLHPACRAALADAGSPGHEAASLEAADGVLDVLRPAGDGGTLVVGITAAMSPEELQNLARWLAEHFADVVVIDRCSALAFIPAATP